MKNKDSVSTQNLNNQNYFFFQITTFTRVIFIEITCTSLISVRTQQNKPAAPSQRAPRGRRHVGTRPASGPVVLAIQRCTQLTGPGGAANLNSTRLIFIETLVHH